MVVNPSDELNTFKASVTRIFHANGAVVGAGFLVSSQYVLTCAHVVAAALSIPENTTQAPTCSIDLDFPLVAPGEKLKAQVVFWQPMNPSVVGEDMAGLKLEGELPNHVQPVRLVTAGELWAHPIRIFGFPSGHSNGVWASGVLRDQLANAWVQIEVNIDEIPQLLNHFIDKSSNKYSLTNLLIELFLPLDLLNYPVDSWGLDEDFGFSTPIGQDYRVVVRSSERLTIRYSRRREFWKNKWQALQQLKKFSACSAFLLGNEDQLNDLIIGLKSTEIIGLKLAKAPVKLGKGSILAAILETAIPAALWLRQNLPGGDCQSEIDQIALARALRPLMRKVPSQTQTILDEEETVTQIAEKRIWVPVLKPAPERWLKLALVVEESRSTVIWQEIIAEFQKLTELQGAFRDVRTWSLRTDDDGAIQLFPQRNLSPGQQRSRSPKELLDPAGRRLILLISDCISPIWRQGQIHNLLKCWSKAGCVAIVQLLPEQLWERTALGAGFPVQLSALVPGVPNAQLMVDGLPIWEEVNTAQAVTLPVVTLEPNSLKQWSQVVAGVGNTQTAGILFELSLVAALTPTVSTDNHQRSAAELVKRFRTTASPIARRLAGLMAAAPVSLPVVYLIQETLLKESMQVHVAEVFMSGLLQPITSDSPDSKSKIVQYEFVEGVRELLLDSVPIPDVDEVLEAVSQYIARKAGLSIKNFAALLSPRMALDKATEQEVIPFAQIATQVLRRLGGEYAALAQQLEHNAQVARKFSNVLQLPPLSTFEFDLATLSIEDETNTSSQINLQPFNFEVALIEINQASQIERIDEEVLTKIGENLNDVQQLVLQGVLANQTYAQIAALAGKSVDYLPVMTRTNLGKYLRNNVAPNLWKILSTVLGEKVTKGNAKKVIEQWADRRYLTLHRFQQQAQSFIEDLGNGIELEMVLIPEGSFMMGSPEDEPEQLSSESPQHQVTVKSFFMGKYPVTQAQWQAVATLPQVNRELDPDPSYFKGEDRPVEQVSWYDAVEFCTRLSKHTGRPYRVPSEAEWESTSNDTDEGHRLNNAQCIALYPLRFLLPRR